MASSDEPRGGPPAAVEDTGPGVSRRSFLKSVGVTGVVAGVVAEAAPTAQAPAPAAVGPGDVSVTLTVNGAKRIAQGRTARHTARRASQPPRHHGPQARMRPWHVWSMHGRCRWQDGLHLLDAGHRSAGQGYSHHRRTE